MINYLARRLTSMKRIFAVMIAFGLVMGLVFPYLVNPFVSWDPGRKLYFRLMCLAAGFAVGAFCYLLVKVTLARRKAELEEAKKRFSVLTHAAITRQDWEVSLHNDRIPTCWEINDCAATNCPSYGKHHVRCWLVTGTFCRGKAQGHFAQKLGDCTQCGVYRQALARDPISEIGENFNSLMWAVKQREELLAQANNVLQKQYGELEELHRQAKEMAKTDFLTGLRNHGHFQEYLGKEVERARRYGQELSLMMLDLDRFKSVNDRFGHQKGDAVLKQLGMVLRGHVRQSDLVARYGGEEFAVVMPETDWQAAMSAAEKLRTRIGAQVGGSAGLPPGSVRASFGVAVFPDCAPDASSLISAADSALLFAKSNGRNRVVFFRDLPEAGRRQSAM